MIFEHIFVKLTKCGCWHCQLESGIIWDIISDILERRWFIICQTDRMIVLTLSTGVRYYMGYYFWHFGKAAVYYLSNWPDDGVDIVNWSPVLYGILFLTFWKGAGLLLVQFWIFSGDSILFDWVIEMSLLLIFGKWVGQKFNFHLETQIKNWTIFLGNYLW